MHLPYRSAMLLLLSCICFALNAQPDIPVDPLTGKAQVIIPITSISSGSLSASVSLAYNGGGIKVGETEGEAGMGWNLIGGGAITRELRGLPDDYGISGDTRTGWLWSPNSGLLVSFSPSTDNGCGDWSGFSNLNNGTDTEPDIFHIGAPGLSAKFVFDHDGIPRFMPWQDLKITRTSDGNLQISSFEVTTNLGVKYQFSAGSNTKRDAWTSSGSPPDKFRRDYDLAVKLQSYNTTWNLTAIIGPYGETITFGYDDVESFGRSRRRYYNGTAADTLFTIDEEGRHTRLVSINSPGAVITLDWNADNTVLSRILVESHSSTRTRVFNLVYNTVNNANEATLISPIRRDFRNYLVKVVEETENCEAFPAFEFEYYNPGGLPYKRDWNSDLFGYYNGGVSADYHEASKLNIYENVAASNGERFRVYPAAGYTQVFFNGQRTVNPATIYYGSLKKIQYPSGGNAQIAWEPNTYWDETAGANQYGAGVRVSQIKLTDGDADTGNDIIRNYTYTLSNGTSSSGRWMYPPIFGFNAGAANVYSPDNLSPDESILYQRTTVALPSSGKTVYEYLLPGRYIPGTFSSGDWLATKTRIASSPTPSCPTSTMNYGYYTYPFPVVMDYSFEQGLISTVQTYNQAGVLRREQLYSYQRINNSNPVSIKGMKFEPGNVAGTYVHGVYDLKANINKAIQTETTYMYDESEPTRKLVSSVGSTFSSSTNLLTAQSVTNSDGKAAATKYKYAADYTTTNPVAASNAAMIKKLKDLNMHATVVEKTTEIDATVKAAELTLYHDFGGAKVYPMQKLIWAGTSPFTASSVTGNPQQFNYDAGYYVAQTIEGFNTIGMPLHISSSNRNVSSLIYGFDKSTPVASISNARSTEVAFSDFENTEAYQIAASNSATSWTGIGSYQLSNGVHVTKTNIVKTGAAKYRFRCRAMSSTGPNVTLTVRLSTGASTWIDLSLTYPSSQNGKWVLLEGVISMSTVQPTFSMRLVSNATLLIDDVALYPDNSVLLSSTIATLVGKTSETDNRGVTAFYEYDNLGRPTYTRDTDRNIRQLHEYRYQSLPLPVPRSSFTCSGCNYLLVGQSITLTAVENEACISPITYAWRVNGVVQGSTTNTLNVSLATNRDYEVQLTVTHPNYGSSSTVSSYKVHPPPLAFDLDVDGGDLSIGECDPNDDQERTFRIDNMTGVYSGAVTVKWYYSNDLENWDLLQTTNSISTPFVFSFVAYTKPEGDFWIMSEVSALYGTGGNIDPVSGETMQAISFDECP
jgi:YD repeat-containing protein